jgi:hypothetical protein
LAINALHKETWIMEFEDYKDRDWTVIWADPSAKHAVTDIVTFHGSKEKVEIQCKRYPDGQYKDGKISGGTEGAAYTIIMAKDENGNPQIEFKPSQEGSGGIGGSWTANDTPPGPGDS